MTETTRTIPLVPTWRVAVQILTTALENGTETGKDAARTELSRMADILDSLREQDAEPATLWDVIASDPERRAPAFGQAFSTEAEAKAYAERLEHHGYAADAPLENAPVSLADALTHAADHFGDGRLTAEAEQ